MRKLHAKAPLLFAYRPSNKYLLRAFDKLYLSKSSKLLSIIFPAYICVTQRTSIVLGFTPVSKRPTGLIERAGAMSARPYLGLSIYPDIQRLANNKVRNTSPNDGAALIVLFLSFFLFLRLYPLRKCSLPTDRLNDRT